MQLPQSPAAEGRGVEAPNRPDQSSARPISRDRLPRSATKATKRKLLTEAKGVDDCLVTLSIFFLEVL